jgi:hypothetical protein
LEMRVKIDSVEDAEHLLADLGALPGGASLKRGRKLYR